MYETGHINETDGRESAFLFIEIENVLFSGNACSPHCWPCVTRIYRRLGIMWSVTIRKSGWGLLKSSTAMPTPTPAQRIPPLRIRTAAVRRGIATPKRASSRGRAGRTGHTRPRGRLGRRPAVVQEATIPLTSPTLPVVYLAAPLTAISPTASKLLIGWHSILLFHWIGHTKSDHRNYISILCPFFLPFFLCLSWF